MWDLVWGLFRLWYASQVRGVESVSRGCLGGRLFGGADGNGSCREGWGGHGISEGTPGTWQLKAMRLYAYMPFSTGLSSDSASPSLWNTHSWSSTQWTLFIYCGYDDSPSQKSRFLASGSGWLNVFVHYLNTPINSRPATFPYCRQQTVHVNPAHVNKKYRAGLLGKATSQSYHFFIGSDLWTRNARGSYMAL